jgi:hypothetical protein
MKNALALLALSLMSVSCINLTGNLNINEVMTVKKRGGFLNLQMKTVELQPGHYEASLKVNNAQNFTLKLKAVKEGDNDILIPIKSDKAFNIPTNGNVAIRGAEIAQPFDISGEMKTDVTESEKMNTTESCTVQRTENHCDKVCHDATATTALHCDIVCRDVVISIDGSRYVEYHNVYTHRALQAELLDSENKSVKASFEGTDNDSDRVSDCIGECRIR